MQQLLSNKLGQTSASSYLVYICLGAYKQFDYFPVFFHAQLTVFCSTFSRFLKRRNAFHFSILQEMLLITLFLKNNYYYL